MGMDVRTVDLGSEGDVVGRRGIQDVCERHARVALVRRVDRLGVEGGNDDVVGRFRGDLQCVVDDRRFLEFEVDIDVGGDRFDHALEGLDALAVVGIQFREFRRGEVLDPIDTVDVDLEDLVVGDDELTRSTPTHVEFDRIGLRYCPLDGGDGVRRVLVVEPPVGDESHTVLTSPPYKALPASFGSA
jgi:hypothetical protein